MRAVVTRELIVIAKRPALTAVTCTHVGLLTAFVLMWSHGVPLLRGTNVYEQQHLVQWWLLALLLPWAAARCSAPERGNALTLMCALTARRPSSVVIAKSSSLVAVLALIVFAGFPAVVVAQQMAAISVSGPLCDLLSLMGLAVLVSATTVTWLLAVRDRLGACVGATVSSGLVLLVLSRLPLAGIPLGLTLALVGAAIVIVVARWSDGSLRYLLERDV